jgi:hypothetical protein
MVPQVLSTTTLPRWFGLADFEPGDGLGGGAGNVGQEPVAVVDAEGGVGVFDVEGVAGVADTDVDLLPGDDEGAAAVHAPLHSQRFGCGLGWWSCGPSVTQAGQLGWGERVGQAAQQGAVVDDLQQATFTGYPIISQFDLDKDAGPLFVEALRVLALKSAVFELSGGDEHAAELVVAAPVDEMVHAVLAQYTLCQSLTERLGIRFVHMTDRERFGWNPGDYTHECYAAAGWGDPDPRYWIDDIQTRQRLAVLCERYESIGIHGGGRRHDIDFGAEKPRLVLAG